jgi:chorismate dehydratase
MKTLRLGAVPYLNVAPMIHGLQDDPSIEIVRDVPSRLLDRLRAGEIDVATIPSVDYARADLEIVPGIAIASRGPVRSVKLVHRVPLADVRLIAVDTSSHTSIALLRVLARDLLAHEPRYTPAAPEIRTMLEAADAALMIGDPALFSAGEHPSVDLGREWTAHTGLPFVYAFWAAPRGRLTRAIVTRLRDTLAAGQAAISRIAMSYNGGAGRSAECESYLRESVVYEFGAREQQGLLEFYRRCRTLGILDTIPELAFHGHS